ncbi:MAG: N-acyl homoserine lactonase family protein [Actinobacteria bacterium]|nr:MAG: N-acyl homoserine lactonase family protein [Actinomycetota bacterium]
MGDRGPDDPVIGLDDIRRVRLGHYTMPADSSLPNQKIIVLAYVIRHPEGLVLFDTGIGEDHEEAERRYHPIVRRPLREALSSLGVRLEDITAIVNCHFHLDHCGGNPLFPGTPIFAQEAEYEASHSLEYTLPHVVDFEGAKLELHAGEADVAPGLRIIPTPGHTPGHQSLLVETREGRVLIAGQAMNDAAEYGRAEFAGRIRRSGNEEAPEPPDRIDRIHELLPRRVFFAHDPAVWEPFAD